MTVHVKIILIGDGVLVRFFLKAYTLLEDAIDAPWF